MEINYVINALETQKKTAPNGEDYWMARDILTILGYVSWQKFEGVLGRAQEACEGSGVKAKYHFIYTDKVIEVGKGAKVVRRDCYLTRYACYLAAMNAESSKPEVATAQTYFAVQTRRQEVSDDEKRIELRERVRIGNHLLHGTAKSAGVERFALFNDAGYRGLYGMGLSEIKNRKKIGPKENLLDRAGRAELAANDFRITQTQEKLERENIHGEHEAIRTHKAVGEQVRDAIARIGGTMPENLPVEQPIRKLIAAQKKKAIQGQKKLDLQSGQ